MSRTLILGGGFGGIAVATELRAAVPDDHEIVLVDRAERFAMGLRKLWELVGHATIAEGSRPRAALAAPDVQVVRGEITAIDPAARSAVVDGETIAADQLVVALGAVPRPDLVDGLSEHGHDIWNAAGVPAAAAALRAFSGGRIVMLIAGAPYPCPPAPYECAFLLDEHLTALGLRSRSQIEVATVQPMLMPNAGKDGSEWMGARLAERGIGFRVGRKVERVGPGEIVFEQGALGFDLLVAVPPHRAPEVAAAAGLTNDKGWVPVDAGTLATEHPGVYAVGDVTQIVLANGLPLPKAGVMAEQEGAAVAAAIAAEVRGGPDAPPFAGTGYCFIEMGTDSAALFQGDFYAEPAPVLTIEEASAARAAEKRAFEVDRLVRWFEV